MGRRVSVGVVPGGVGQINVSAATISTSDTDQDLTLTTNGTGRVIIEKDTQLDAQADLRFADADSSNFVALQAPTTVSANYTLTLPAAVASSNGLALISDTSGALSWAAAGAALADNNSDSNTNYITFTTQTSGNLTSARVATSTRPLSYQPSTGTLTATAIVESSSITLKENLVPITDALSKVLNLQSYTYDRKDGSSKNEVGLIAEYVNPIIPELVLKNENGEPVGIKYTKLTAYLVESIKTLKTEIDRLCRELENRSNS
jgi:hypothetical protein